ncbi:hypothetical protein NDS46_31070 (plasmid) [Paenibacillus thiaminolyticus]|uniref:hypothetical protein n=1 Tax=Paenibacillus thiaminolyticus TaxID=49283 RepID=UPI00232DE29F|nr:hypothetical protein [Paenibacillus thiaminolyticus]WCF11400.1 hypothetical protein NDS46_31070 [Paenibacillus thiaminolyticus]
MDTELAVQRLDALKSIYHKEVGILSQLTKEKEEKEKIMKSKVEERDGIELKKVLVSEASEEARKQARDILQDMGTSALKFIMGDHMTLEIELKPQARQQWVANFISKSNESGKWVETDPAEEEGGGVADVVAISTQTSMLQLTGENNVAPWFLDEPSKYVSKGHSEQVALFLKDTSTFFNRQTFMVTHDEYLANVGDVAYHFRKTEGTSHATKIT